VISGAPTNKPPPPGRSWLRTAILIAAQLLLILFVLVPLLHLNQAASLDLPYSEFKAQVAGDNVGSITFTGSAITGSLKQAISYGGIAKTTSGRDPGGEPDCADPGATSGGGVGGEEPAECDRLARELPRSPPLRPGGWGTLDSGRPAPPLQK
jgi:hypothetical protein